MCNLGYRPLLPSLQVETRHERVEKNVLDVPDVSSGRSVVFTVAEELPMG